MALPIDPAAREEAMARRKAAEEEALLREVDDAVRQDDLGHFGRRYGVALAIGLGVVLVGFGGYLYWDHHQEQERERQSETLVSAMDRMQARDFAGADEQVQPLLEDAGPGAGASARMMAASAAVEAGNMAKATELLNDLAGDADAPEALRNMARVRVTAMRYDSMDKAAVVRDLQALARPDSPWFGSAGELTGMALLEQGKRAEAGRLFADIAKNDTVPESIRSRARQMAGVLGVDAIEDVDSIVRGANGAVTSPGAGA